MKTAHVELPVPTADGVFLAHYSETGLAALNFPKSGRAAARAVINKQVPLKILRWHRLTLAALKKMLAGSSAGELPPLDWSGKKIGRAHV